MAIVTVYSEKDFDGVSEIFGPGKYYANNGDFRQLQNDSLSSLKIEVGTSITMREHEDGGAEVYLPPGNYASLDPWFDNQCSFFEVHTESTVYLSSDDKEVPSWIDNIALGFTAEGNDYSGSVSAELNNGNYSRTFKFPLHSDITDIWEFTKNGDAGWDYNVDNGVLTITLVVSARWPFAARNWVGVRFKVA